GARAPAARRVSNRTISGVATDVRGTGSRMAVQERHELCVIGAGTAGFAAAQEARERGRDVVLVTGADELGGTCIRRGCMPAKAMLAATQYEGDVAKAGDVGVRTSGVHVDLPAIIRRKRALVDYFAADRVEEMAAYPLVRGDARFVAPDAVEVDGRRIVAERFVVATGAATILPDVPGESSPLRSRRRSEEHTSELQSRQ